MANPSKVEFPDGSSILDLTNDTVTPNNLFKGVTAHDAKGDPIVGTVPVKSKEAQGSMIAITDGSDGISVISFSAVFDILQSGEDAPSFENVRPFVGYTNAQINHTGSDFSETISVDWSDEAGTIYEGTLNILTGELTVEWVKHTVVINESTTLNLAGTNGYRCGVFLTDAHVPSDMYERADVYCNTAIASSDVLSSTDFVPGQCLMYPATKNGVNGVACMIVVPSTCTNSSEALSYMVSAGTEFVYKLAEPLTFQFDSNTVKTVLGNNAFLINAGTMYLEYVADASEPVVSWGDIDGNIADQADLQNVLALKANESDLGGIQYRPDYTISNIDLEDGVSELEAGKLYFYYEE